MGGSATFGSNLVDELIESVVDPLRSELLGPATGLGVRQYRVFRVVREWEGEIGEGDPTFAVDEELDPPPMLVEGDKGSGLAREPTPGGYEERGSSSLKELSLSYTEEEIAPSDLPPYAEFYYRVVDGLGQGVADRFFTVAGKPTPDREKTFGWIVPLVRAQISERAPLPEDG